MIEAVLYIQPGASRTRLVGLHDGRPKIAIHAKPVEGAANRELVKFLAELLAVSRSDITIVSGETSRLKRVRMPRAAYDALLLMSQQGADGG